jgi:hypothetical protein
MIGLMHFSKRDLKEWNRIDIGFFEILSAPIHIGLLPFRHQPYGHVALARYKPLFPHKAVYNLT